MSIPLNSNFHTFIITKIAGAFADNCSSILKISSCSNVANNSIINSDYLNKPYTSDAGFKRAITRLLSGCMEFLILFLNSVLR